jgi:hypothetical protein
MGQTADQLRQEVDATRDQAAEKIDMIEQKVGDAAQQVKDKVNWRRQVDDNPLLALGVAMIGGMALGSLLGGDDGRRRDRGEFSPYAQFSTIPGPGPYGRQSSGGGGMNLSIRQAARSSGLEDALSSISGSLMASLTDKVREIADQTFSGSSGNRGSAGRDAYSGGASSRMPGMGSQSGRLSD